MSARSKRRRRLRRRQQQGPAPIAVPPHPLLLPYTPSTERKMVENNGLKPKDIRSLVDLVDEYIRNNKVGAKMACQQLGVDDNIYYKNRRHIYPERYGPPIRRLSHVEASFKIAQVDEMLRHGKHTLDNACNIANIQKNTYLRRKSREEMATLVRRLEHSPTQAQAPAPPTPAPPAPPPAKPTAAPASPIPAPEPTPQTTGDPLLDAVMKITRTLKGFPEPTRKKIIALVNQLME